jgi:hypothetical protein
MMRRESERSREKAGLEKSVVFHKIHCCLIRRPAGPFQKHSRSNRIFVPAASHFAATTLQPPCRFVYFTHFIGSIIGTPCRRT